MQRANFHREKAAAIRVGLSGGMHLNCAQVKQVLRAVGPHENHQVETAIQLYPCVVDRQFFMECLEIFSFSSSKQKVIKALHL